MQTMSARILIPATLTIAQTAGRDGTISVWLVDAWFWH